MSVVKTITIARRNKVRQKTLFGRFSLRHTWTVGYGTITCEAADADDYDIQFWQGFNRDSHKIW
jgi:hypothetical protein